MKKLSRIVLCISLATVCSNVSAQGFLKAFTQKSETQETTTEKSEGETTQNKIKKEDIPAYTCVKEYFLDENNQRIKNEDGTDKYVVRLKRTSDGAIVSPEVAQEQSKQINKAILAIAAKAGVSAGIGALSGGGKGALVGLATGIGLSVEDIILVVKLKKDTNKQKKALEAYRATFDEEGNPKVAEVDKKTLKLLEISEDNAVEKTTAQIQEELSKPEYSQPVSNESIDALLNAATKV